MKCDNPDVPDYLHWNDRAICQDRDFRYFHKLYRLKVRDNPVEIDPAWANAISCRWSRIIRKKHICIQPSKPTYLDYHFVFLQEIRRYKKTGVFEHATHEFTGKHIITCEMSHSALPCDFSHVEILIRHKIFKAIEGQEKLIFDEAYTYEDWRTKRALLAKDGNKFFKQLKQEFRLDMIKLISRESKTNHIGNDGLALLNLARRSTGVIPNFRVQ